MSRLADYMRAGRFVITSELTPPKGIDLQELLGRAEAMRAHVDAFNITESPRAHMAARGLGKGRDFSGAELQGAPRLFIGATVNPGARDVASEIANVRGKIDAGAQFLQTQALYDVTVLERFLAAAEMDSAGAQQRETAAGIEIAARLVSALRPMVAGVHIKALGWEAHIAQMLARSNL